MVDAFGVVIAPFAAKGGCKEDCIGALDPLQGFAGGLLSLVGEIVHRERGSRGYTEDAHLEDICLTIGEGDTSGFIEDSPGEGGTYAEIATREICTLVGDDVEFEALSLTASGKQFYDDMGAGLDGGLGPGGGVRWHVSIVAKKPGSG